MTADFQREHRYWVIKRKHLTPEQDEACHQLCSRLHYEGVPLVETVSVESDWPIYEMVWHLVKRLTTGQRLPFMTDEDPDVVSKESDALAANGEHCYRAGYQDGYAECEAGHAYEPAESWRHSQERETIPAASLARHDLLMKIKWTEETAERASASTGSWLLEQADELRRQANKETDHD